MFTNLQEHWKTQKRRLQRVQALAVNQGEAGRSDLKTKRFDSILSIGLWCARRCLYYFSAGALLHVRPRLQAGALTHSLSLVLSILLPGRTLHFYLNLLSDTVNFETYRSHSHYVSPEVFCSDSHHCFSL